MVLILPKGGGQSVKYEDKVIKIITPESPLGAQLVGKSVDDMIQIKNTKYLIVDIK